MNYPRIRFGKTYLGHNRASWKFLLLHSPCAYCGAALTKLNRSIDHIRPRAKWNTQSLLWRMLNGNSAASDGVNDNITGACQTCNQAKGTKELLHFMLEKAA